MRSFKYTISFRIEHPNLDPRDISAELSLQANTSWMAGDQRSTPTGRLLKGKYKTTYWSHVLEQRRNVKLAECLDAFTTSLEAHEDFLKKLRSTGGKCEYFIGWFSGCHSGEIFGYQLLSRLSRLGIDLALDVYG